MSRCLLTTTAAIKQCLADAKPDCANHVLASSLLGAGAKLQGFLYNRLEQYGVFEFLLSAVLLAAVVLPKEPSM